MEILVLQVSVQSNVMWTTHYHRDKIQCLVCRYPHTLVVPKLWFEILLRINKIYQIRLTTNLSCANIFNVDSDGGDLFLCFAVILFSYWNQTAHMYTGRKIFSYPSYVTPRQDGNLDRASLPRVYLWHQPSSKIFCDKYTNESAYFLLNQKMFCETLLLSCVWMIKHV